MADKERGMGLSKLHSRGAAAALLTSLFLLGLWLSGCNLFSPLAADNRDELTYRGLILKGNEAINDGDFDAAEAYFSQAMQINPEGSEAYLFHAKSMMDKYRMDYNHLNGEFDRHRTTPTHPAEKGVPFVDSNTTLAGIDSIYFPVATAVEDLEHILRKESDTVKFSDRWMLLPDGDTASDGRITDGVARLDLGLLQAVKALLAPLDLDGNNHIDSTCGKNICPNLDAACMSSDAYKNKCKEGPRSEVNRLETFKKLTQRIDLEHLDSKDVNARNVSNNPNDINGFLDAMQAPIAASNFNLDSVTSAMDSHQEQKLSSQLNGIVGNITDLNSFLNYMRFNDGIDNDLDAQDTSKAATRMIWFDYDKDNGIKYNYDDSVTFQGLGDAGNIGHPIHRWKYKETLYLNFTEYRKMFPAAAADTGKNSRIALMIKHCDDVVNRFLDPSNPFYPGLKTKYPDLIKDSTCSKITTVLRPGITPPRHSDWRRGTPGVDEEEIDEHDNDYDGLKDEDARNARYMDDDDDDVIIPSMWDPKIDPPPMTWQDVKGHENKCPDIDTTLAMKPFPDQRENCIGSIENRIWWVQHYPSPNNDSIAFHYSQFTGFENGPSPNCLEDFLKLPIEYRQKFGDDATTRLGSPVRTACAYKHIWKAPRPPNSEWTKGTFGIDEEKLDGVDNDGDGWIDEDLE
jgi:hypothetical protein